MNKVRVRFAPSPTGFMHIGNFRGALYNYLFAKQTNGDFILRIEDTDKKRYVEGALESLIKSLNWAGLKYDEGAAVKSQIPNPKSQTSVIESKNYKNILEIGDYGPYVQSERLEIYKKYAKQLVDEGKAYYCFCTPERLEEMRKNQEKEKQPPMYDRYCLKNLSKDQIEENLRNNISCAIRLNVPKGEVIEFDDIVRGKVQFSANLIDDQILLKSDGFPTYHLANVVDDHLMKISHVIRGEEWLSSTPKHILLYNAFEWEIPQFAHLPLILNPDKTKLSKRQGDVAVEDYIEKGYLKEALINFIALLGWNPGKGNTQEIFLLEELVQKFNLEKVHKSGAVFDIKKLDWINNQYIKKLTIDELYEKSLVFFKQKEFYLSWDAEHKTVSEKDKEEYLKKVLTVEQERLVNLSQAGESDPYFFKNEFAYSKDDIRWKKASDDETKKSLEKSLEVLENILVWEKEKIEEALLKEAGDKRGDLLFPLRWVLTGQKFSPTPFEVAWVLGKKESARRVREALKLFE